MDIKDVVKQKYSEAALRVLEGGSSCCCGPKAPSGIAQTARMSHEIYRGERDFREFRPRRLWPRLGAGTPLRLRN